MSKVRRVLCDLDVSKAVGPDGISPRLLKNCYLELCQPLFLLFRRVSSEATIPASWKIARITPVYKCRGSVTNPSFYRPVSVLPTLALLFERVISSQLYNRIMPFVPQSQYSFVKVLGPKIVEQSSLCLLPKLWNYVRNAEWCRWTLKVPLTIFGGMVCRNILAVLVFVVELLLYFNLICPTDICMLWPMLVNLLNIQYKLEYHRVQFGHRCFLIYIYVRHLPSQVHHSLLVSYADDSTLSKQH